ncbi:MAG: hypothetical protein ACI9Y1_002319, partial [Lentisphaeria bacterium]
SAIFCLCIYCGDSLKNDMWPGICEENERCEIVLTGVSLAYCAPMKVSG